METMFKNEIMKKITDINLNYMKLSFDNRKLQ